MSSKNLNIIDKRIFVIGSEWFSIKIYSGPKTLEHLFVNEFYQKIEQLFKDNLIDYFFFIRYTDPDYHIRLRLHIKRVNNNNLGKLVIFLNKMLEEYIANHVIIKMTIDTYNREIERYGNEYNDIEKVFYFDSLFILNYLVKCNEDDQNRWLVSIKYIDLFLQKCGFSLDNKIEFCKMMSSLYAKEIYSDAKFVNKQLSEKFRNNRKKIATILEADTSQAYDWIEDVKNYVDQIVFFTEKVKHKKEEKTSSRKNTLLSSIIHMHINRMFRTKQRINECVIYYLLLSYYKAKSMIEKNNIN